jgi:hypothetical protein
MKGRWERGLKQGKFQCQVPGKIKRIKYFMNDQDCKN